MRVFFFFFKFNLLWLLFLFKRFPFDTRLSSRKSWFLSLIQIRNDLLIHYWLVSPVKNSLISVKPLRKHYPDTSSWSEETSKQALCPEITSSPTVAHSIEEVYTVSPLLPVPPLSASFSFCWFTLYYWEHSVPQEPWSATAMLHESRTLRKLHFQHEHVKQSAVRQHW